MPTLTNPYTAGDPVGKTNFFVGREDVLREVLRVLKHPSQNAITLFGQRRIGKTSILQYLEAHLPEQGEYLSVYFDLMNKTGQPLGDTLRDLARTIAFKLNLSDPNLGSSAEKTFRESYLPEVLHFLPKNASLVLLLDEFDVLADPKVEQQSKREFFSYLRDLRQLDPQRLQFVFVLGRNMDDLDVVAQGLFKDLPSKRVSLLNQNDAEILVRLSERNKSLDWTPTAVAKVWELTSGHPYLTQALCSQVWEDAYDVTDTPSSIQSQDVENAVSGTLERSQNMFAWLWEGLGSAEKVVASALAGVGREIVNENRLSYILAESGVRILIGELRDAPQILQNWDILDPINGGYRFKVELLRLWIVENKPLSRTQEELDRINPLANSLFDAAKSYYLANSIGQAESLLRQALGANPNHIRASELLSEILLANGNLDEAQQVLEKIEEMALGRARPRLKQTYLQKAELSASIEEKLRWYEKVLLIIPGDRQASEARNQIYRSIGEQNLQANNLRDAIQYFQQAGDSERIEEILFHTRENIVKVIQKHALSTGINEVARLEKGKSYEESYQLASALAETYPNGYAWQNDLPRLKSKASLGAKQEQALALLQKDPSAARVLFSEIVALDPDYKKIIYDLYVAVIGEDPEETKRSLAQANKSLKETQSLLAQANESLKEITDLAIKKGKEPTQRKNDPLSYFLGNQKKLSYLPPRASIEGHGIKRGLTAVETAILMEQPLDNVMAMTLFGVIKKNAAAVKVRDPLELNITAPLPEGLHQYEKDFLTSFKVAELRLIMLQNMMINLIKSVSEKMRGFSRKETVDYYKSIMEKAWQMVEAANTPEMKSQKMDEVLDWAMLDKNFADHIQRVFSKPFFVPRWWGRYDPIYHKSALLPSDKQKLSGKEFATSIVICAQIFSQKVMGDLNTFTKSVASTTNPNV